MKRYREALKAIDRDDPQPNSATMAELVCQGLVTYKSSPVITGKGRAVLEVNDDFNYYYHHPRRHPVNCLVPITVVEVHGKQWIVKNCDSCGKWLCHVSNIYMQPK